MLERLSDDQYLDSEVLSNAEAFVCQLYNLRTKEVLISKERAATFRRGKKSLIGLSPNQDALHLHIKQAFLQAFTWKKGSKHCPVMPSPGGSGWCCGEGTLKPTLVTMPQVSAG